MSSEDVQDKRMVVWLGEIPPGKEHEMRYPTEEELEFALYLMDHLSDEECAKMTEEEYSEFEKKAKEIVKERLQSEL